MLEGGATLNECALQCGIVNKLLVYIALKYLEEAEAKSPVAGKGVAMASKAYNLYLKRN